MNNIVILGGGKFGTALAQQLSFNSQNSIHILLRDVELSEEINEQHCNSKYYPNCPLNPLINASTDYTILKNADVLLLALPSKDILSVIANIKENLPNKALVVNTAKGIFEGGKTIVELLNEKLPDHTIATWKGASFSDEMINRVPTLLTLGFENKEQISLITEIINNTNIFIDYSTDIRGIELLSAIKNVYAILLGHVDGRFNTANTRFMVFTQAVKEIKIMLEALGGSEETIFLSCGIGDIALTGLTDLSRNRTLGLLIGKNFYNSSFSNNSVVLEGVKTLNLIDQTLTDSLKNKLPLLAELTSFLIGNNRKDNINLNFTKLFTRTYTTVLTYGTFDLIHFGHLEILRRAKALGDRLIVGLSTDEFNALKGKKCEMPYAVRKSFLESLDYVDLVIPEENWEQKVSDVERFSVDIFVMGSDWAGKFDFLNEKCEVQYLARTRGISTTALKKLLKEND